MGDVHDPAAAVLLPANHQQFRLAAALRRLRVPRMSRGGGGGNYFDEEEEEEECGGSGHGAADARTGWSSVSCPFD